MININGIAMALIESFIFIIKITGEVLNIVKCGRVLYKIESVKSPINITQNHFYINVRITNVARTLQKCQRVCVGFAKSSVLLKNLRWVRHQK